MKATSATQSQLQKEEEDLAKAIALSIKESTSSQSLNKQTTNNKQQTTSSLYGTINIENKASDKQKVKALYDFEAVEDNEITFKAGDILFVTDSSDQNWWKGYDKNRKEGLFPSNFVTSDLDFEDTEYDYGSSKKVSFDDKVNVKDIENEVATSKNNVQILIDEKKIDECIDLLQNADPTGEIQPDSQEMLLLEDQCYMMGPLIDQHLQKIDYKHAVLEDLNIKILEAFQMYNNLMKESITKSTSFSVSSSSNNFNPNFGQSPANFIPFVAAPPQSDANPHNLANQLNNFANYNNMINTNQNPVLNPNDMQQNVLPQDQYAQSLTNYQNYNSMYQQYGQMPHAEQNNQTIQNPVNSYSQMNSDPNNLNTPQNGQYNALPNQ